jgi:hypothetical protein
MKEKPILFSTLMVEALFNTKPGVWPAEPLDASWPFKWQTRRVVKPQPVLDGDDFWQWKDCQWHDGGLGCPQSGIDDYSPYKPGDILWMRETWGYESAVNNDVRYCYKADNEIYAGGNWRPSIHMPREVARLFLEVKAVRIERLRDITEEDAKAEGVEEYPIFSDFDGYEHVTVGLTTPRQSFQMLWDSMNAKNGYTWESNPWVWVYEFGRIEKREKQSI